MANSLELDNITMSQTFSNWVSAFNSNNDTLEGLPLPIEAGTAHGLRYMKFASGDVAMWGTLNHGTSYPCNIDWQNNGGSGFASKTLTITYPIGLVNTTPVVLYKATDSNRCEIIAIPAGTATTAQCQAVYWSPGSVMLGNQGTKTLDVLIIGRWK